MGTRKTALGCALALTLCGPAASAESPFAAGRQSISLAGGYGLGMPTGVSAGTDLGDVRMGALLPSWSIGLTDPLGGDAWYRGNLELLLEGVLLINSEPQRGYAGGATVNFRWNALAWRRVVPYFELGAGFGALDFSLDKQADGFSFFLQAGLGARWLLNDRAALYGGWRFHHISNANTNLPNIGLNSSLFLAGVTYYLD